MLPALHYIFAFLKKKSKGCRFDQGYSDYFRFHNDAKIGKLDSILELNYINKRKRNPDLLIKYSNIETIS
jgi:hypothetical protein